MNIQGVEWTDGNTYDAYTGWDVSWNYRYQLTDDGCSMASVTTTVNVVFRMPRWTNYADASAALKEKWDAYIKSLTCHEIGHKDIGVSAAFEIEQSLAALKPALTCSELAATANELGSRIISKYAEQERQYDIRTHFGKTQGAIFP
jgi:predicted secreted Zn-dependent protease